MRLHHRGLILGVALGMAAITTPQDDVEAQSRLERAVAMVVPTGDANRYWPRWRGPSGQGLAVGTGYPDRWSDTENVLWKTPVAGRGHSSPIVWADRLFLTTATLPRRRVSGSVSAAPTQNAWRRSGPDALANLHRRTAKASATPATDGDGVYASLGSKADLLAVDFEGRVCGTSLASAYHGTLFSVIIKERRIL